MNRRTKGAGTLYQREDGLWCGLVELGRDGRGKRVRKSVYGKTKREAEEALIKIKATSLSGVLVRSDERQTVGQYLHYWLECCAKPSIRPSTLRSYEQQIRCHLSPSLGHIVLTKLQPQHLRLLMNEKLESGLSPRSVDYLRVIFRKVLNQAIRDGLITRNIATLVDKPRQEVYQSVILSTEEINKFIQSIKGHRLEALYLVMISLGLRKGEVLALKWSNINLDKGTLEIKETMQRIGGKIEFSPPKTNKSCRLLKLPSFLIEALQRQQEQLQIERSSCSLWNENDLVFPSEVGTPLEPRNLTRHFNSAIKEAGLKPMRVHDLRHTAATFLLMQGIDVRVVQMILGHSNLTQTMRYTHVLTKMLDDAAGKMDAFFTSTSHQMSIKSSAKVKEINF